MGMLSTSLMTPQKQKRRRLEDLGYIYSDSEKGKESMILEVVAKELNNSIQGVN